MCSLFITPVFNELLFCGLSAHGWCCWELRDVEMMFRGLQTQTPSQRDVFASGLLLSSSSVGIAPTNAHLVHTVILQG